MELDRSPFSAALAAAVSDQAFSMGYQTLIQQTRQMASYESSMVADIATQFCEGTILSAPVLSPTLLPRSIGATPWWFSTVRGWTGP
ncbi:hypothetical protein [Bifidobacterium sp. ESL0827]|uniref:hypothetical protein n=1 Tax=Bifidobacterium sp. ESL0827 TaxID=3448583 RepID=UPI004042AAB4